MTTEIKRNKSAALERSVCRKEEAQFISTVALILYLVPIVLKHSLLGSKVLAICMMNDCMYNFFKVDEIQSKFISYPSI